MPKFGVRIQCSQCVGAAVAATVEEMLEAHWFRRAGAWVCPTHRRKGDIDDGSVPFVNPHAAPPAPTTPCGYLITAEQLARLERAAKRLHTENRMDGDTMRDMGHTLAAIVRECRDVEIP